MMTTIYVDNFTSDTKVVSKTHPVDPLIDGKCDGTLGSGAGVGISYGVHGEPGQLARQLKHVVLGAGKLEKSEPCKK